MFEQQVRDTILRYRMVEPGDRVLVAVSGGPDSVALLSALHALARELRLELHVAHLDHGWRGRASARDAEFVRRLATRLGLPVTVGHLTRAAWEAAGARVPSREARARELRSEFLLSAAKDLGARRVALGHTRDDQAESLLLRLMRGSGARGLAGIYPVVDGVFIRPLIELRRRQVIAHLKTRRLRYRIDATNKDQTLSRNRVRRRLLPLLAKEFNPAIVETLAQTADLMREEDDLLGRIAEAEGGRISRPVAGGTALLAAALRGLPVALQRRVLRGRIEKVRGDLRGITLGHVDQALALLQPGRERGSICLPRGLVVRRHGEDLMILRRPGLAAAAGTNGAAETDAGTKSGAGARAGCTEALCPVPGEVALPGFGVRIRASLLDREATPADLRATGRERAYLDADLITGPLLIRPRRPGDRFVPLGAPGSRKVKTFLIDRKIPVDDRGRIPLVLTGDRIAWVVDHAIDERFKVTGRTRRVLVLEKEPR
ncbi:MAG: tRNA lysidine(34) synthetase TilS [Candidatus Polarisedimenticolia bacterium]